MPVNGKDWPTAEKAIDDAYAQHRKRSRMKWTTDFGLHQAAADQRRAQFRDRQVPIRK